MKIEFLSPESEIDPENDNVDILLHLDDGRTYSFVVATPQNIFYCMENEGVDYFFGVPPVFVKRLDREIVQAALTAIAVEDGGKWLAIYGSLQTKP
jgi:hypothetical protein